MAGVLAKVASSFKTETRGPKKTGSFSASDYRFTSLTKQWSRFEATQRSDSAAYDQYIQAMAEVPLKRPGGTRGYAQAAYLSWTATLLARPEPELVREHDRTSHGQLSGEIFPGEWSPGPVAKLRGAKQDDGTVNDTE